LFPTARVSESLPLGGYATWQCGACPASKHYLYGFNSDHADVCSRSFALAQRKRPPLGGAAKRWGICPSRGNDASGRKDRVRPEMVSTLAVRHLMKGQAGMRQAHPSSLESATLNSIPRMRVDGGTGK
jgi:hypothetical protein